MKKNFMYLMAIMAVFAFVACTPEEVLPTSIAFEAPNQTVCPGDSVNVSYTVNPAEATSYEVRLEFDDNVFTQLAGVEIGNVLLVKESATVGVYNIKAVAYHLNGAALSVEAELTVTVENPFSVKTLTFEGDNWDALIDNPQYGGKLLYTESGEGAATNYYSWSDATTLLESSGLVNAWGSYCYWNGGQAISNYTMADFDKASYNEQLSVCTKGGHGGSKNFCVHFGTGEPGNLPALSFSDGVARVIESMYVVNTAYMQNAVKYGDGWSFDGVKDGQYAEVVAYGYDAEGKQATKATFRLVDGPNKVITDWTIWNLTALGEVTKVEFAVTGNVTNDYGFALPAYFAYDDVSVRFPKAAKK